MILLLAGLPGVGKTTMAKTIAPRLHATILNRDAIRDALFLPQDLDYSAQQNHIATRTLLQVAEYLLSRDHQRTVILDGRPMSRANQIEQVAQIAGKTGHNLRILHCVAPPDLIASRLAAELVPPSATPIDNRLTKTIGIARDFEPITHPHLIVDTSCTPEENLPVILTWLDNQ